MIAMLRMLTKKNRMTSSLTSTVTNQLTITGGRVVTLSPFVVAGIVNATPDSFSDGGLYLRPEAALIRCMELWSEGAGILDIGGESTRPGSDFVDAQTEMARLRPVLEALAHIRELRSNDSSAVLALPELRHAACLERIKPDHSKEKAYLQAEQPGLNVPQGPLPLVSVDTWRASTARASLELGAEIINDISGAMFDPEMAEVLAAFKPGYILGHAPEPPRTMQNAPSYANVVEELYGFFARRIEALTHAGLPQTNIALDVGIGFGKNLEHNLSLLRAMDKFHSLGCPLCLGVSRKTVFGDLLGLPKGPARDSATQVVTALMAAKGVQIHRVHAVRGLSLIHI